MSYGKFNNPLKPLKLFKTLKDIFKKAFKEILNIFFKENQIYQSNS